MDALTQETQALISAHQNPEDCGAAEYFVWRPNDYGIGSDLHTTGWALGQAIESGRVLVYHPDT
jgi:hypothetical protein